MKNLSKQQLTIIIPVAIVLAVAAIVAAFANVLGLVCLLAAGLLAVSFVSLRLRGCDKKWFTIAFIAMITLLVILGIVAFVAA